MTTKSALDHSLVKWQKPKSTEYCLLYSVLRAIDYVQTTRTRNTILHVHVMADKLCGRCQTEFTDWNNSVCTSVEKEYSWWSECLTTLLEKHHESGAEMWLECRTVLRALPTTLLQAPSPTQLLLLITRTPINGRRLIMC